jgi:histone acetyltransferase (RNA polymerase elongator complex component)
LYENVTILSESDFSSFSFPTNINTKGIRTFIFGIEPDLTSYRHFVSLDTRSREVRNKKEETSHLNLIIRMYQSSVGIEYFISYEDILGYLYGFARVLLPDVGQTVDIPGLGVSTALIRELHVYGELQKLGNKSDTATQHRGLGKKLLHVAEQLAQKA